MHGLAATCSRFSIRSLGKQGFLMAKQTKITIEADSLLILRAEVPCVHGVPNVPQK
jgi:hypothetical protein